ncbi:MAG: hypothetical protein MZW92_17860 [Comamonadaceae bacterium]|nr:hypothetical protein [Comamonadaceae bacterium]
MTGILVAGNLAKVAGALVRHGEGGRQRRLDDRSAATGPDQPGARA